MNVLTLDVETTISNKGNPFDQTNELVCVGFRYLTNDSDSIFYEDQFHLIQGYIDNADLLVGFNIKFDLHWLRRAGIDFSGKRIWDCQIGEFLLNDQLTPYPSLDGAAMKYGYEKKLDIVKEEYWNKGIDTDEIPRDILSNYLSQDLILTEQVYLAQVEQFRTKVSPSGLTNIGKMNLFKLQCADLLVLEEMEWNGISFASEKARAKAEELQTEIDGITKELSYYTAGVPVNPNSNDHISCLLYGGIISVDDRIPIGVYKTGQRVGETRYKIVTKEYELPRLVDPLKGTETKWAKVHVGDAGEVYIDKDKPTHWKTNADVLRSLKLSPVAKKVVGHLTRYSELEKLRGTYLIGWSNLIEKMNWPHNKIHGTLNQCVAVTGRLSSTKPNLQNADPTTKIYCESEYNG